MTTKCKGVSSNCTTRKTDVQPEDTGLEKENEGGHGQQTAEEPLEDNEEEQQI